MCSSPHASEQRLKTHTDNAKQLKTLLEAYIKQMDGRLRRELIPVLSLPLHYTTGLAEAENSLGQFLQVQGVRVRCGRRPIPLLATKHPS